MEHILWECITSGRTPDLEATAQQVSGLLWSAFAPPKPDLDTLRQLQVDVAEALRRYEEEKTSGTANQ
jgi:hypothetical protein